MFTFSQDDVEFVRYMAENFATLEYKLVEEVLQVVKLLTGVLSTLGMQCMHNLQPEGLAGLLNEPNEPNEPSQTAPSSSQAPSDVEMTDVSTASTQLPQPQAQEQAEGTCVGYTFVPRL